MSDLLKMFNKKADIDRHVRTSLERLKNENEKNLRGFTYAKMYFKIGEYSTVEHYLTNYLKVKEETAAAHKLLGQCYQNLKKYDKSLMSFQRSLQLDKKQPELIIEVCKLLCDDSNFNIGKAQYWADLAESERIRHDCVLNLRLKLLSMDNMKSEKMEEFILKQILNRPREPVLRIRLIKYFIDENRINDAFKYAYDIEMKHNECFTQSIDWYNTVSLILVKYKNEPEIKCPINWEYYLLSIITIERQLFLNLCIDPASNYPQTTNITDCVNLLFEFDQLLSFASKNVLNLCSEKELAEQFLCHYGGQFCLHTASVLFKRQKVFNKNPWREVTKTALPFLLISFNCGTPDTEEFWLKHSSEANKLLIQEWNKQGAFRCSQSGRTILSCIENSSKNSLSQIRNICSDRGFWLNPEDLLAQIRQTCSDTNWRKKLFQNLFTNEQSLKVHNSYLVQSVLLNEPIYEIPSQSVLENYEEIAQYLLPSSLQYFIYLGIGLNDLIDLQCKPFENLKYSVPNLSNCSISSLNKLDMNSFLCCSIIQAKKGLINEKIDDENYNSETIGKPMILPFANIAKSLGTSEQITWWESANRVYRNLSKDDLGELRITLQYGIEVIRGIGSPRCDLIIFLKLGDIFSRKAQQHKSPVEKQFLEERAASFYKYGLQMLKMQNKGNLEAFRKFFTYPASSQNDKEIVSLSEDALKFLAGRYFKNEEFEECIEEFTGLQLPFATYFQAEAYRRLDESTKTPKKSKVLYKEKAEEYYSLTSDLLTSSNIDRNHPLRSILDSDMRRRYFFNKSINDTTTNGSPQQFQNDSIMLSRREPAVSNEKFMELEVLIKQVFDVCKTIRTEIQESVKTELSTIKTDIVDIQAHLFKLEDLIMKKRDENDGKYDLDDLCMLGEELQAQSVNTSQVYPNYTQQQLLQQQQQQQHHQQQQHQMKATHPNFGLAPWSGLYDLNNLNPYLYPFNATVPPHPQWLQYQQEAAALTQQMSPLFDPRIQQNISTPKPIYSEQPAAAAIVAPAVVLPPPPPQQQQQQPQKLPTNYVTDMLTGPSILKSMYPSYVDKTPPVNVVITSSDPLPTLTTISQPPLSVTIPSHHIKNNNLNQEIVVVKTIEILSTESQTFSIGNVKLFVYINKEPSERGAGTLTIFKNSTSGKYRLIMLQDKTNACLLNHPIVAEMKISISKNQKKSAIWSANDVTKDVPTNEKFYGQFKTDEFAKEFYDEIDKIKTELSPPAPPPPKIDVETPKKSSFVFDSKSNETKSTAGGFTFSSTPLFTTPTTVVEKSKELEKKDEKLPCPFTGFSFGNLSTKPTGQPSTTASNFSNLFSNITSPGNKPSVASDPIIPNENLNKSAGDDDDYVPTAQFQPVIALPDLIETKTGEEDEIVLFEHRGKLLRYDSETKEWKERGLGILKILSQKNDVNKVRLLMRRETILKICCNQVLLKDTIFKKLPNTETALSWVGQDFSECELKTEFLAIRFKTAEIVKDFHSAILLAQSKMSDQQKDEEKVVEKKPIEIGFGDKFKPKAGAWNCTGCYTSNTSEILYCIACETPKDDSVPKKEPKNILTTTTSTKFSFGVPSTTTTPIVQKEPQKGFGDLFKPKVGSWSCNGCYTQNQSDNLYCLSCEAPKDDTVAKKEPKNILTTTTQNKFVFGVQTPIKSTPAVEVKQPAEKGFGDLFKPKPGSWSCTGCYTQNTSDNLYCLSCETPKDETVPKKEPKNILASTTPASTFTFGSGGFTFGGAANQKPIGGSPLTASNSAPTITATETPSKFVFGGNTAVPASAATAHPSVKNLFGTKSEESSFSFKNVVPEKKNLETKNAFEFVFQSKSPTKAKSPVKNQDSDNECVEEEENNTYFQPVIPLPEKIDVKTGEEEEECLYSHRSKLYRFIDSEWKERGLGDVKLLKHRITEKLRVVMRREQIFKICLNHVLTDEVQYIRKDDKAWSFIVNDFSEGVLEPMTFCLRFKTADIADEFKQAIDSAIGIGDVKTENDVKIISKISEEDRKLTEKLLLPEDFFNYKTHDDCEGCRGCNPEEYVFPSIETINEDVLDINPIPVQVSLKPLKKEQKLTEIKMNNLSLTEKVSSSDNIFGGKGFSAVSTNIFGSKSTIGASFSGQTVQPNPAIISFGATPTIVKDVEAVSEEDNEKAEKSIFGGKNIIRQPVTSFNFATASESLETEKKSVEEAPKIIFGGGVNTTPTTNTSGSNNIFGSGKSIFGGSSSFGNSSIFSSSSPKTDETKKEEKKNIFQTENSSVFTSFTVPANQETIKKNENIFNTDTTPTFSTLKTDGENLFKTDSTSFASLANSSATAFSNQNVPASGFFGLTNNQDFSKFMSASNDKSINDSKDSNTGEEAYDPHYDPIIALPDEIVVSTGEEEETKVYGERSKLFKYDTTLKEWKERGVGELKILHHKTKNTYRLLLRREQIFKCVLNHGITAEFVMNPMNTTGNAYCWATINYAEMPGELEQLAARFKNNRLAEQFETEIKKIVEQLKSRGLEPEQD